MTNSFFPLACPSQASGFQGSAQSSGAEAAEGLAPEQAADARQRQIAPDGGTGQPEAAAALAQY